MPKPPAVTVYPVPGHYLAGFPAVPVVVDADTASRLASSGAFTRTDPGTGSTPVAFTLTTGAAASLDFYAPADPGEAREA